MNKTRRLFSMDRVRYEEDGFSLDLTYITPRIIAMGFPATGVESLYRNKYSEAVRFLDEKHPGHYKVYNLCSESSHQYNNDLFHGSCAAFPFPDHNPPPFDLIHAFCNDASVYLKLDPDNVIAIHCKAGKGRTGVMISSLLLYMGFRPTALECMQYYGEQRDKKCKGVTIPSQRRYIEYYEQFLEMSRRPEGQPPQASTEDLSVDPLPVSTDVVPPDTSLLAVKRVFRVMAVSASCMYHNVKSVNISVALNDYTVLSEHVLAAKMVKDKEGAERGVFSCCTLVLGQQDKRNILISGDVRISVANGATKLGDVWFNTGFIPVPELGDYPNYVKLEFTKPMIDKMARDDKHKVVPPEYTISTILQEIK